MNERMAFDHTSSLGVFGGGRGKQGRWGAGKLVSACGAISSHQHLSFTKITTRDVHPIGVAVSRDEIQSHYPLLVWRHALG